jgi:hypothetical protein
MEIVKTSFGIRGDLLENAYSLMPNAKKKDVIETALEEFIQKRRQKNLRDIREKITFFEDYDYKAMRTYENETNIEPTESEVPK